MLDVDVRVRRGSLDLRLDVEVAAGQTLVVLGPNGAGKTTLLEALAGLVPLTEGRVVLDGVVLEDATAGRRVPPESRGAGVVFQRQLLFPHLSVVDNVAFGPRSRGASREEARENAHRWLVRVGLLDHDHARPSTLSGGQAQRVAIARALAGAPSLLLLDEPLASLDVDTRQQVRSELRHHLAAFDGPAVVVTHDPLEALTLGDVLVIVEDGVVTQQGTPAEVAQRPRSPWVARLVGVNLVRATANGTELLVQGGSARLTSATVAEGDVFAVFHPRAIALHRRVPEGSPRNVWEAEVADLDIEGQRVRVHLGGALDVVAEVTPGAVAELDLGSGGRVHASLKAVDVDVYPA